MKFLAFVFVGIFIGAQADFVRLNLDNEIASLVNEVNSPRHVRETNPLTRATQTVLSQVLEEKLKNVTDKIKNLVATGRTVSKALLEQSNQLLEALKQLGGKHWLEAHPALLRNLTTLDLLVSLKNHLNEIKAQLKYIFEKNVGVFGKRDLFENFEEELLNETVALVLADRGVAEWWQGVKDTLSQALGGFTSKFADLQVFIKQYAGDLWGKVKGHFDNVKLIAQEYLAHAKDASLAVTKELLEFLEPYKQDLGSLWTQVVQAAYNRKHIVLPRFTPPPVLPTVDFKTYVQEKLAEALNQAHLENIKLLITTVLAHPQQVGLDKLMELKQVAAPYKSDLGVLWQQLLDAIAQTKAALAGN